jgi:hypothetical protein
MHPRLPGLRRSTNSSRRGVAATMLAVALVVASCGGDDEAAAATATATPTTAATATADQADDVARTDVTSSIITDTTDESSAGTGDLTAGFQQASWGDNVTVTFEDGALRYRSDGLPNHPRNTEYAVPTGNVVVPDASSATAIADPSVAQEYDYSIPLVPTLADEPTSTSLGVIGVMISGAALFNPYEGDGSTVATQSNFSVKNAAGDDVWFLDDCAGHPTPMGQFHYHGLPTCVTATVDEADGPSHIIGIAFDGFPIYGDRDIDGNLLTADDLDECNGITSPTPEFPEGVYHYVLLDVADSTSSIRCFSGVVDDSLVSMAGMPGMGPPPAP